jgi:hypothetical protein
VKRVCHLFALLLVAVVTGRADEVWESDIVVYGATAGGVAAAVQAARAGENVILLEPGLHIGGMTSGGLGQTDIGNKAAIGGIAREFYQRVGKHYGKDEAWTFEPHVAEDVLFQMLNESRATLFLSQRLAAIKKQSAHITEISTDSGKTFRAKIFIDATYEGDLMARAGVTYTVGREANSTYNETLNGVRAETPKHQFVLPVDPYKIPGDPASGLLPLIQNLATNAPGAADKSVQAYNFRLVLTKDKANQRPILPPKNYDAARYELLARYLEAWTRSATEDSKPGDIVGHPNRRPTLDQLMHIQMMPGGKTDVNNNGGFSTDYIGANYDYPDADYANRAKIFQDHEDYTRGLLHFLSTSPRVPENIRTAMQPWGLTRDEFIDTAGWPHQLYIREARRMISDYVMTELNCTKSIQVPDAIALAAYTMDSHNCRRIAKNGIAQNEGDVQVGGFPPYPISYRSIVPKQTECENLLVPICLSASHIAYGSIRMEPVFMVLGHSAADAAIQAINQNVPLQKIRVETLQMRLLNEKQILRWNSAPRK